MDVQTIVSVLGLVGIGGIIGSYLQYMWSRKKETELKIQELNEETYRSTLVFMRCVLNPENVTLFNIKDPNVRKLKSDNEVKEYAKRKIIEYYYNSLLYAPDEVLLRIKEFVKNPSESNLMKTAIAMRKDLWKKKTKVNLETLSLE